MGYNSDYEGEDHSDDEDRDLPASNECPGCRGAGGWTVTQGLEVRYVKCPECAGKGRLYK